MSEIKFVNTKKTRNRVKHALNAVIRGTHYHDKELLNEITRLMKNPYVDLEDKKRLLKKYDEVMGVQGWNYDERAVNLFIKENTDV